MNPQDTIAVVAYFGAAWPTFDPSDDTVDVWVAELADVDPADARDAMRQVVRTSDFPPSIAKFRAECKAIALQRQQRTARAAGLPASGPMPWPAELVADLKAALKEASIRKKATRPGAPRRNEVG